MISVVLVLRVLLYVKRLEESPGATVHWKSLTTLHPLEIRKGPIIILKGLELHEDVLSPQEEKTLIRVRRLESIFDY